MWPALVAAQLVLACRSQGGGLSARWARTIANQSEAGPREHLVGLAGEIELVGRMWHSVHGEGETLGRFWFFFSFDFCFHFEFRVGAKREWEMGKLVSWLVGSSTINLWQKSILHIRVLLVFFSHSLRLSNLFDEWNRNEQKWTEKKVSHTATTTAAANCHFTYSNSVLRLASPRLSFVSVMNHLVASSDRLAASAATGDWCAIAAAAEQ